MKRLIIVAGLAALMGAPVHAQDGGTAEVPAFRACLDTVMAGLGVIAAPPEETAALTMNMPEAPIVAPEPEPNEAVPAPLPPPPPPMPARPLPLNEHLARECPVMRIEAGDLALGQYCDPVIPSDKWSCAIADDGSATVSFAPR